MNPIIGSIVALVTPMREDGSVDYEALRRLIDWHIAEGTDCIGVVGTTGESPTVSVQEHCEIIRVSVEHAKGRVPIMAGAGGNSTQEAIELSRYAKKVGADCTLSVVPYYNKPSQEGIYRHFKAIAEAADIPMVLYNVPGRTGCDLKPETVARLADTRNIIGLKEAASLERNRELLSRLAGRNFALLSGDDDLACECVLAGFNGVVSVSANVAPRQVRTVIEAALAGKKQEARKLDAALQPLHKAMFLESNPIPVKWALARTGMIAEGIRLPLTPLAKQYHGQVVEALLAAGVALA